MALLASQCAVSIDAAASAAASAAARDGLIVRRARPCASGGVAGDSVLSEAKDCAEPVPETAAACLGELPCAPLPSAALGRLHVLAQA